MHTSVYICLCFVDQVMLVVVSVALCVCGSNSSRIAGNMLKDKMGFGLFPKEQLDTIHVRGVHALITHSVLTAYVQAIHHWQSSTPGREVRLFVLVPCLRID